MKKRNVALIRSVILMVLAERLAVTECAGRQDGQWFIKLEQSCVVQESVKKCSAKRRTKSELVLAIFRGEYAFAIFYRHSR